MVVYRYGKITFMVSLLCSFQTGDVIVFCGSTPKTFFPSSDHNWNAYLFYFTGYFFKETYFHCDIMFIHHLCVLKLWLMGLVHVNFAMNSSTFYALNHSEYVFLAVLSFIPE